jgi:ATP-binding cassette subfamily B protein
MRSIWRDDVPRTTNPLSFFIFVSKPHLRMVLLSTSFVVLAAALTSFIPYVYKLVTEGTVLLASGVYQPLVAAVGLYFFISTTSHLLWRASGFSGMMWATGMRATARSALFSHLSHHSYQYFSNRFAGSLLSKLKQAGDGSKEMVNMFLWDFLSFFITLITSFIIVFTTSIWAGLILFAFLCVIVPFNYILSKKRIPISIAAQNAETVLNGATVDAIANMVSVHEYVARDAENERLKSLNLRRRALGLKNWQFSEWLLLWNGLFVNIFFGTMVFFRHISGSAGDSYARRYRSSFGNGVATRGVLCSPQSTI